MIQWIKLCYSGKIQNSALVLLSPLNILYELCVIIYYVTKIEKSIYISLLQTKSLSKDICKWLEKIYINENT